jgi:hypothetical protein
MKGAWIATIILLTCSVSLGGYVSESVGHQRADERECSELRAEQPVWPNERNLPGELPDYHELYPWQERPDVEFDREDAARCLPPLEFDHHSDITRAMPDIEFDGGSNRAARPQSELSAPGDGNRHPNRPAQANPPVQARKQGQSQRPVVQDGGDAAKVLPPVALDHTGYDYELAWPSIEFDGGDEARVLPPVALDGGSEAKSLPPKLAW